ncbi:MAG: dockerin type I repeat-containing protein [Ruminococcus sp.]|nr:dockerin type I repeat-containing protein [Ruminococcus sp.]
MKRLTAILLAVLMVTSVCVVAVSAESTDVDFDGTYYKGAYYYRPGTGEYDPGTESVDYYTYTDDYFKVSGKEYNPHLATVSFALATASVSSTREPFTPEGYMNKSRNATAFLEDIGFSHIALNADYYIKPTKNTIGVACARKNINMDGKDYTLLVILPRSAGYEAEWGDNFVLGADGNAKGFEVCTEKCLAFAKEYVAAQEITGDIKVWTSGYSRGASIANLIAGKLIDDPAAYLGENVTLTPENLYAYTCGTPSAVDVDNDPRNEKYAGIFNAYLNTELASAMAPVDMGFERYGTDRLLYDEAKYDKMLEYLKIANDYVGTTYAASINSRYYVPKKLSLNGGTPGLADNPDSYITSDPAEYLAGLCTYLTRITESREIYEKLYEQPLSDLIAYYERLTGDEGAAFMSAITGNDDAIYLVVSMYAYFMRLKSRSVQSPDREALYSKTKELAAVAAGADAAAETGIDATVIAKAAAKLGYYMLMSPDDIKREAGAYFSSVVGDAMRASGATSAEIRAITNRKSREALVHLVSHLLLGNIWQSDEVRPFDLNNEQIQAAATLIGNAANLFVDHANEIIISWLKLDDSYFSDYQAMTEAQLNGYRRVYLNADDLSAVNGDLRNGAGAVVATIRAGKLTSRTDTWVGFTNTDDGGFFRVPAGSDYMFCLTVDENVKLSASVSEYSVYDAAATPVLEKSADVTPNGIAYLVLSARGNDYSQPTDAYYDLLVPATAENGILGDGDLDGEVSILDTAWIQRFEAELVTASADALKVSDVDDDGEVTLLDATYIQRWLNEMPLPDGLGEKIGKPISDPS